MGVDEVGGCVNEDEVVVVVVVVVQRLERVSWNRWFITQSDG